MSKSKLLAALAAATALTIAPAGAIAKPSKAGCKTTTYRYDTGGSPGSGQVNDPLFPRQWGLQQINAPKAWARGVNGRGAVIAMLDTGVDLNHPDLKSKLLSGVDLVADNNDCPRGPQDENGHGTHTAGIAAAATNNGIGVAGTAPAAKILPIRVLDADGSGDDATIAKGIKIAADRGADVINMSLGELPVISQIDSGSLDPAIDYAWSKGSLVVASAGNETFPLCDSPAWSTHAVCVAATDSRGLPSYYSNFPNNQSMNGFRAPGGVGSVFCEDDEDIWSTMWPGSDYDCQGSGALNGYDTLAGTSMAAPFVSGVAALMAGQGLTNQQILDKLKATSSNHGAYDPVYGYGIVNADAATR